MARQTRPEFELAYAASRRFINALQSGDSILTPGKPVWTLAVLRDFVPRFVGNPQHGKERFIEKYRNQLSGASALVVQLAAELLYAHFIASAAMKGDTKRRDVREVLSWSPEPISGIDDEAMHELDGRLVLDQALNMRHPDCVAYLAKFATAWLEQPASARDQMLQDPWAFRSFVMAIEVPFAYSQREILIHMVHPDTFEKMSSTGYKERIAAHFDPGGTETDLDRRLLSIRQRLTPEYGQNFDFWEEPLLGQWLETGAKRWQDLLSLAGWDAFIGWSALLFKSKDYDRQERTYKLEIGERMRMAREAVLDGRQDWVALLKKALTKDNNLIDFRVRGNLFDWFAKTPDDALAALQNLWRPGPELRDRIARFLQGVPADVLENRGRRVQVVSVLLMAEGVQYPPIKIKALEDAYELVGHPDVPSDPIEVYLSALEFLDEILDRAQKSGAGLRDRLDAQSTLWMLVHWSNRPSDWSEEQWEALVAFREAEDVEPPQPPGPPGPPKPERPKVRPKSLDEVAARLYLPVTFLEEVRTLLTEKKQVIFYGPPGTGKTFVALELAAALTAEEDDVLLVQFHPSYAYEDFVEGYRPRGGEGQSGFQLRSGPMKKLAEAARDDPNGRYVLVIDEMNRGNLARVFGELFFLLEYRGRDVSLQYSPDQLFSLPPNLWIIGTMNTADRSIALIDAALRRRFAFVPFFPDTPPIKGLLGRWFANRPALHAFAYVADVVDLANERLAAMPEVGRHLQIGPSFFMREDLSEAAIERIWAYSIKPFLEEQFFGREAALEQFELASLKAEAGNRRALA